MSRRRTIFNDPTARLAVREDERLVRVLEAISPREASIISMRFGLTDGHPKRLDEIGRVYGVTRVRVQQILEKALTSLRESGTANELAVRAHGDQGELVDVIDVIGTPTPLSEFERLYLAQVPNMVTCGYCTREFANGVTGHWGIQERWGRPRRYCSNKCRQAAYRLRRAQARCHEPQ